jgi:hypothetical protein
VEVTFHTTPHPVVRTNQCLYKKEVRAGLTSNKLNKLYKCSTKNNIEKYDLLMLSMTVTEKLDDTYNLQMTVEKTRKNHIWFNMGNVFQVININSDMQKITEFVDLYKDYTSTQDNIPFKSPNSRKRVMPMPELSYLPM